MIKIVHIITGLGSGGAENMLYKLLKYSDKNQYHHEVITLKQSDVIGDKIKLLGIKVHEIHMNKTNLWQSLKNINKICAPFDIIDTWLYHSDFIGFIIAKMLRKKKLIWNIRHSNLAFKDNKLQTYMIIRLNALLSKSVDMITYNSNEAKVNHQKIAYTGKTSKIIFNGFDLDSYKFDSETRNKLRQRYNINGNTKVLITVGRWYIQKDYPVMLEAINEVVKEDNNIKLFMCGTNLDDNNTELKLLISKYNLEKYVVLLGRRHDISELLVVSDIYLSSSLGESFSNSIGEAMASQIPCVVTDVGESSYMVGSTGEVCESRNPQALKKAIVKVLNLDNREIQKMGIDARDRIKTLFEIKTITKTIEHNYEELSN